MLKVRMTAVVWGSLDRKILELDIIWQGHRLSGPGGTSYHDQVAQEGASSEEEKGRDGTVESQQAAPKPMVAPGGQESSKPKPKVAKQKAARKPKAARESYYDLEAQEGASSEEEEGRDGPLSNTERPRAVESQQAAPKPKVAPGGQKSSKPKPKVAKQKAAPKPKGAPKEKKEKVTVPPKKKWFVDAECEDHLERVRTQTPGEPQRWLQRVQESNPIMWEGLGNCGVYLCPKQTMTRELWPVILLKKKVEAAARGVRVMVLNMDSLRSHLSVLAKAVGAATTLEDAYTALRADKGCERYTLPRRWAEMVVEGGALPFVVPLMSPKALTAMCQPGDTHW